MDGIVNEERNGIHRRGFTSSLDRAAVESLFIARSSSPFVLFARHRIQKFGGEAVFNMAKIVDRIVNKGRDGVQRRGVVSSLDCAAVESVFELVEVRHCPEMPPPFDGIINLELFGSKAVILSPPRLHILQSVGSFVAIMETILVC